MAGEKKMKYDANRWRVIGGASVGLHNWFGNPGSPRPQFRVPNK